MKITITKRKNSPVKRVYNHKLDHNYNQEYIDIIGFNIIIFSEDKPCQLELFLKSLYKFWSKNCPYYIFVIYTYNEECYKKGYDLVKDKYSHINYYLKDNFKNNLLEIVQKYNVKYTVFFTDNNVFIDEFNAGQQEFIDFENNSNMLCFCLLLGNNIVYDYSNNLEINIPHRFQNGSFEWAGINGIWGYPTNINSCIFKTDDIIPLLKNFIFDSLNTLNEELAKYLIKEKSRISCPNLYSIVMNYSNNYFIKELNNYFINGLEIDLDCFYHVVPESICQEIDFTFTTGISVLMPLYNGIEFIDKSVQSILDQTHEDWELIIGINGHGENPNFYDEIKIKFQDPRIKILNFPKTKGKSETLNEMIPHCKYQWIAMLDVDDYWDLSKLKKQIQYAGKYNIIGTRCKYFSHEKIEEREPYLYFNKINKIVFSRTNPIINSSSLFRKENAYWNSEFEGVEDYEMWLRLNYEKKTFYNLRECLTYHRLYKNSLFNTKDFSEKIILAIDKWKIK